MAVNVTSQLSTLDSCESASWTGNEPQIGRHFDLIIGDDLVSGGKLSAEQCDRFMAYVTDREILTKYKLLSMPDPYATHRRKEEERALAVFFTELVFAVRLTLLRDGGVKKKDEGKPLRNIDNWIRHPIV